MTRTDPEYYRATSGASSGAGLTSDVWGGLMSKFTSHGGGAAAGGYGPTGGGSGNSAMRGIPSQVRPGMAGLAAADIPAAGSVMGVPGPFMQITPNTPAGLGAGDAGGVPVLASQGAIPRVRWQPTGAEQPAGPVVANNYPNLRGLASQAGVWS